MGVTEAYFFLFVDSILSSMILVPNTVMAFNAMLIFGGYNLSLMVVIAVAGSAVGVTFNYLFGLILNSVKKKAYGESEKYSRLRQFSAKWLVYLSFFSFLPLFGVVITTFLGLMRVNYKKYLVAAILGSLIYFTFCLT